ncbi:Tim44 domain-containing protein [Castellaniella sp.]|uniref:Tim44 domain-containing protein n=1 Tax=Castellaniella sp. TaxID=1955812 RepID=UPI002AFE1157|nr:TIM44-like domain-containing protein [Castellaniella sp.]
MIVQMPRWFLATLLLVAALMMLAVTSDAQARRMGGGASFGRQSSNVTKQRQAVTPPAATTTQRAATPAAGAAAGTAAAGAAAKSGMSRWLGPIAGIAAGLGIAALLSSMGLSGAFLEFLSSALLIGLVIFAVMFLVRRLRGAQRPLATAGAAGAGNNSYRQSQQPSAWTPPPAAAAPAASAAPVIESVSSTASHDPSWFIPGDFDVPTFLNQAKQQFTQIQALWDAGDRSALRELLTDDLLAEITPRLPQPGEGNHTEIVLLNAELLGIEAVAGGHLASVRYSGMLREAPGAEAFRLEEVWNLYKADGAGWLLAGIQQLNPQA